eukprot:845727-Prymnesium_polylepis.1
MTLQVSEQRPRSRVVASLARRAVAGGRVRFEADRGVRARVGLDASVSTERCRGRGGEVGDFAAAACRTVVGEKFNTKDYMALQVRAD